MLARSNPRILVSCLVLCLLLSQDLMLCCSCVLAADARFDTALALYGQRRYKEAGSMFLQVLRADPHNGNAYFYAANCYYAQGDIPTATKMYNDIINAYPNTTASVSAKQVLDRVQPPVSSKSPAGKRAAGASAGHHSREVSTDAPASIASLINVVRARKDRPPVTAGLIKAVTAAVDGLPPSVKGILWNSSIKINITPTIEDYKPGLKYEQARGYEGGTYKSCPALYDGSIVLAEHTLNEEDESVDHTFSATDVVNSFYHESGHALDNCLNDFSQDEEFKHAYLLDVAKIDPETAEELRYFLQKSAAGQEECCAELIGLLLGQTERHTAKMRASFPLTLAVLRKTLKL